MMADSNVFTIEGDADPAEPVQPKRVLTTEEKVDIYCRVIAEKPVLNWKKIMSDSFHGNQKRDIELPEFYNKYKK